jgi:hypothetical protein
MEGPSKMETVTRRAAKAEAERRRAAGRRTGPKREPEQITGYGTEGTPIHLRLAGSRRARLPQQQPFSPCPDAPERPASSTRNGALSKPM